MAVLTSATLPFAQAKIIIPKLKKRAYHKSPLGVPISTIKVIGSIIILPQKSTCASLNALNSSLPAFLSKLQFPTLVKMSDQNPSEALIHKD